MLKIAKEKAKMERVKIKFVRGDIKKIQDIIERAKNLTLPSVLGQLSLIFLSCFCHIFSAMFSFNHG